MRNAFSATSKWGTCIWMFSGLEKSAAIRPFATKKSRLASETFLLADSLATELELPFSGQVGDQTFFQGADNADEYAD